MTLPSLPYAYWIHDLSPFLIRFSENFGIRWYGLSYILGFLGAIWLLNLYYKKGRSPWNHEQQLQIFWALVVGVLVGGRLGYILFYDWEHFLRDPMMVIRIWEGGMASHGGFIGIALAILWTAHKTQTPFLKTSDIIVTLSPPGLFFGRVANFINGELWGKPSDLPWAIIFPQSAAPGTPLVFIPPRHPSQIYEALLEGLFLGVYTQLRFWLGNPKNLPQGQLAGEFLLGYAILRTVGEAFREPDASLLFGLSRGVFYSLFVGGIGIVLIAVARSRVQSDLGGATP